MKVILNYIRQYFYETNKRILIIVSVFTAILIFLNYHFTIDHTISKDYSFGPGYISRYGISLIAFVFPYLLYVLNKKEKYADKKFWWLLFIAPALFALKMALDIPLYFSNNPQWNNYWNHIFYWPVLVFIISCLLFIIWKIVDKDQPFYGIKTKNIDWRPYLLMLIIMLPLVAAASTQPDFLAVYPKLKAIAGVENEEGMHWLYKLLFELSYGSDFIIIELFFRGFLILAFIKWAGKDAILPMAVFYCTIHFGKPLGECISSYFGGMVLGIIVYHTRSILGGLMVHLGIACLMEIGGYFGNSF
ncbi:MAG: CPBP family intramembrane metalloprotease [Chitinophagaceae bacterium]|nr:CPBP family intramembrane metalloprotease [Chitinophagaceae bacterium]